MNSKRGAQSAIESIPGGAVASILVWALLQTSFAMPSEVAGAVVTIGTRLSSYLLGKHK